MNTSPGGTGVKAWAMLALLGLVGSLAASPVQRLASGLWAQLWGSQLTHRLPEPWSALLVGLALALLAWHSRRSSGSGSGRFS